MKTIVKLLFLILMVVLLSQCEEPEPKNQSPTCVITSPTNGAAFIPGVTIKISVQAEDADGEITEVRFYIDDIDVSSSTTAPFYYDWNTVGEDLGNHKIKAIAKDDDEDSKTHEITISLATKNATVSTTEVTSITNNSATGGGDVTNDGGATVTARGICWSTSQNPTTADSYTDDGSGTGSFTSSIADLLSETTYYVRAYATNSEGTAYGDEVSFKTYQGGVTDYDGNTYGTNQIGNQIWMGGNLKATHYHDGTEIQLVEENPAWQALTDTSKAYCYYGNISSYGDIHGVLYTWAAAMNGAAGSDNNPSGVQGVCPDGWHLPSDAEWKELEIFLGMSQNDVNNINWRGTNEGSKMAGYASLWFNGVLENDNEFGSSGLTLIPGGMRWSNGSFVVLISNASLWSATEGGTSNSWFRGIDSEHTSIYRSTHGRRYAFSVRCIKDD